MIRLKKARKRTEPPLNPLKGGILKGGISPEKERQRTYVDIENSKSKNMELDNQLPELILDSIVYSCVSKELFEKIKTCDVNNVYSTNNDSKTTEDEKMGTLDNRTHCKSCFKSNDQCPGHYGMIKLNDRKAAHDKNNEHSVGEDNLIIHPLFRDNLLMTLKSICWRCSQPLLDNQQLKDISFSGVSRFSYISDKSSPNNVSLSCTKKCENKNEWPFATNPILKTSNPVSKTSKMSNIDTISSMKKDSVDIHMQVKVNKNTEKLSRSPRYILKIINNISEDHLRLLGYQGSYRDGKFVFNNHPSNFIMDFIPVIPPSARPYSVKDGIRKDDFITQFYNDVIEQNKVNSNESVPMEKILFYFDHIIDNKDGAYQKIANEAVKSIKDRLKGKKELIRGHMLGKR